MPMKSIKTKLDLNSEPVVIIVTRFSVLLKGILNTFSENTIGTISCLNQIELN